MATFLGESTDYRIEVGPHRLEVHARPTDNFAVGTDVTIEVDGSRCRVLTT
jgi:hypothetical protein